MTSSAPSWARTKAWAIVVPTYALGNGTLKGTQIRFDAPAKDEAQRD